MKKKNYTGLLSYKDALRNDPSDEKQDIITHWQNAENPPKDDGIKIR
jgi:hypothetical protein